MSNTNSRTADKFVIRLPDGMREDIAKKARENYRSMNSQVLITLEKDLYGAQEESWNPVRGMLVQNKEGPKMVYGVDGFDMSPDGTVFVHLASLHSDKITLPISEVKPFMVK